MVLIKGDLDLDIRLAQLLHISQQLRPHFIPSIKSLRKLAYLPVSLNGCSKMVGSEGAFRHLHLALEVSSELIPLLMPVQALSIVFSLYPFLDLPTAFASMSL